MKTNPSSPIRLKVSEEFVGYRLDRFLVTIPEIVSRSYAQNLIQKSCVRVDQKIVNASFVLKLNQLVEINLPEVTSSELIPYNLKLDIVHEDNDLIVINKPSGLVVHPSFGHEQDTLVNALLYHTKNLSMKNEQRPGIVHRIDKETSGLLVIAKNDLAHEKLSAQFKAKTSHRIYYALAKGNFLKKSGSSQSYLARHATDRKKYASLKQNNKIIAKFDPNIKTGKWSITHYEVLKQTSTMSYVKLKLETGRTHQIRVHLSELGHCLVGDVTYGYSAQKVKQANIKRFYLHAAELGFIHPTTQKNLLFKTDWPQEDLEFIKNNGFNLE